MTLVALLSACGEPPEVRDGSPGLPTRAPTTTPSMSATPTPPPAGGLPGPNSPSADPGLVAVACPGDPSAQRIISLVRGRGGLLSQNAKVSARSGPLCAAGWQFTILDVTGYEPLQVVTRKQSGTLRLVTAGTDVCTAEVRVAGPAGIQTLACGSDGALPVPSSPTLPTPFATTPSPTPSGSSPTSNA